MVQWATRQNVCVAFSSAPLAKSENSACAEGVRNIIIASFVLTWANSVSQPPMSTLKRHFERFLPALHAQGGAMEIAIAGMQRWGNSPVHFGVLPTR
jgi:hypothetical protein